jgi:hypothetical protein
MSVVLVTGGRRFWDVENVAANLASLGPIGLLVHGGAHGADQLAGAWARAHGVPVREFPAQWRDRDGAYDPGAGSRRNGEMLAECRPDFVLAFPGGIGTADMKRRARRAGVEVREARPPGPFDDVLG